MAIQFLGERTPQAVTSGPPRPRVYLDSAATTLMAEPVNRVMQRYLASGWYSNPHSELTTPSRVTAEVIAEARGLLARLVDAPEGHVVVFGGSGATEPLNILSVALFCEGSVRDTVVVTPQEHHSNLLPWMRAASRLIVSPLNNDGSLDLEVFEKILLAEGKRIRLVAVTAISNVTGVRNPISEIARIAHRVGAEVVVDATQAVAHVPLSMRTLGIDYLVASGHKMYAPGTPGWMVIPSTMPCDRWEPGNVGGGTVDAVWMDKASVKFKSSIIDRLEGGTVNIPGIVGLGAAAQMLMQQGLRQIQDHEQVLMTRMRDGLEAIGGVATYGPGDRVGILAFNIEGFTFDQVASALNDYFAISVRAGAFCAHPYVRDLLDGQTGRLGMVRASLGMYTTIEDIDAFLAAVRWIVANREKVVTPREPPAGEFSITKEMSDGS